MSNNRRSSLQDHHRHHYHYRSPSFSSTLLEEIYRSIDEERDNHCDSYRITENHDHKSRGNNRFVVDQWIENDKINLRRKSTAVSSTSSSGSSSGVSGFSSSDTDSLYRSAKSKPKPKPQMIRTILNTPETHRKSYSDEIPAAKKKKKNNKDAGNLHRRALKLYGDLKKVKQPISPGGKLTNFLNLLFNSVSASKKPKISSSSSSSSNGPKLERESAPLTAASRSCLIKTPSSTGRLERRSVKFVDDVAERDSSSIFGCENQIQGFVEEEDEEDEESDNGSCCSSELFELENFLEIGVDRYREELPVYETTHVATNRAIACGFIN